MRSTWIAGVITSTIALTGLNTSEALAAPPTPTGGVTLVPLGTYNGGGLARSESVDYDPATKRAFITNNAQKRIDVVSFANPSQPTLVSSIDVNPYGSNINSVAVGDGIVAAALETAPTIAPDYRVTANNGSVALFSTDGRFQRLVTVGVEPDMVTFTPDNSRILVAGEGEQICSQNDPATVANEAADPSLASNGNGTVSIIDVSGGALGATVTTLDFSSFDRDVLLAQGVRVFFPGATAAQDLEPEYITVSADGTTAWVTVQEANAIATVDLVGQRITAVKSLGYKDWGSASAGLLLDTSDKDGAGNTALRNLQSYAGIPLKGMYMPDAISDFSIGGRTYLATANEGDSRSTDDWACFGEEARMGDAGFNAIWTASGVDATTYKTNAKLARLKTTTAFPATSTGTSSLYTYGGRSFSIWDANGDLVWDSGSQFEEFFAANYATVFNSDADNTLAASAMVTGLAGRMDGRSDDKGPEPEGIDIGRIGGQTLAFIVLERQGGIMVYDVSNPSTPSFVTYVNPAYAGNTGPGSTDISPEVVHFIPANESPNGEPALIVANELSGTTTMYKVQVASPVAVSSATPAESTVSALPSKTLAATTSFETGATVTGSLAGFDPFESVHIVIASTPQILTTVAADATGVANFSVTLPSTLEPGTHTLAAFAPVSGLGGRMSVTVGAAGNPTQVGVVNEQIPTSLPETGPRLVDVTSTAAITLLVVGGLVRRSRRRAN